MNVKIDLEQIEGITATSVANWNQAYQWGPHTNMGYLTDIPLASTTVIGGGKLVTNTIQTTAVAVVYNTASRTYAVQLNSSGQMVVNVPWVNTQYSVGNGIHINTNNEISQVITTIGTGNYVQAISQTASGFSVTMGTLPNGGGSGVGATNYITSDSAQVGLSGNKTTSGHWIFQVTVPNAPSTLAGGGTMITTAGEGHVVIGFNRETSQRAYLFRTYASNGFQLALYNGGISTFNHGDSSQWKQAYDSIGNMGWLATNESSNLVGAINEVYYMAQNSGGTSATINLHYSNTVDEINGFIDKQTFAHYEDAVADIAGITRCSIMSSLGLWVNPFDYPNEFYGNVGVSFDLGYEGNQYVYQGTIVYRDGYSNELQEYIDNGLFYLVLFFEPSNNDSFYGFCGMFDLMNYRKQCQSSNGMMWLIGKLQKNSDGKHLIEVNPQAF